MTISNASGYSPKNPSKALLKSLSGPLTLPNNKAIVYTPEGYGLTLTPAGPLIRSVAFVIDLLIKALVALIAYLLLSQSGLVAQGVWLMLLFVLEWLYGVLFEVLNQGQTPGKQLMRIRVVAHDGSPLTWYASMLRNLLRMVDALPVGYLVGWFAMLSNKLFQRVGDLAAGTYVTYLPEKTPALSELFDQKVAARWQDFAEHLSQLEGKNLSNSLVMVDFISEYRALLRYLQLERQRGMAGHQAAVLNALALRAYHQLYHPRHHYLSAITGFIRRDFPQRLADFKRYVRLSAAALYLPMLLAFVLTLWDESLVFSVLSANEVAQLTLMHQPTTELEPAANRAGEQSSAVHSGVAMLGYYIKNNLGVGFLIFAGGLFFGVGSLLVLMHNGVVIGAVAGYLWQLGFGQHFFAFFLGHSAFELTALVLMGAAGLQVGLVLINPGRYGRLTALQMTAKQAMTLVFGAVALLVLAAGIEAFWSASSEVMDGSKILVSVLAWLSILIYCKLLVRSD